MLLLQSIVAFILGTFYETLITAETVVPEPYPVFKDLEELLLHNYKLYYHTLEGTPSIPPEIAYNHTFAKHNLSSILSSRCFNHVHSKNESAYTSRYQLARSLVLNTKTAFITSKNRVENTLEEYNIENAHVKCSAVTEVFDSFETSWIFRSRHMHEYKGVVAKLGEAGILKQFHVLGAYKQKLSTYYSIRLVKSITKYMDEKYGPSKVSLSAKLTTMFYVLIASLGISLVPFLFEISIHVKLYQLLKYLFRHLVQIVCTVGILLKEYIVTPWNCRDRKLI